MAYKYDLKKIEVIDDNRGQDVYRFNLAHNHALLSGDSAVIRRFYQLKAGILGAHDIYKSREITRSFFYNARAESAFVYAGIIPWLVDSIVRLVASSGFSVQSVLNQSNDSSEVLGVEQDNHDTQHTQQARVNEYIQSIVSDIDLQSKFERGVYLESGLGDFAYRISYDKYISDKPILDIIEPQHLEVSYKRGHIYKITIKDSTDDIKKGANKTIIEMHETYKKDKGKVIIEYSFWEGKIQIYGKQDIYNLAKEYWGIQDMSIELPFEDFPIVFKKNSKVSNLYKNERGVPDTHGIDTIEDALSESLSNLINSIRKSTPKTIIRPDMLPTDIRGTTTRYSDFDTEYIVGELGDDPAKLIQLLQSRIEYSSYTETAKVLISHAINKAGLSPTTLGVTGLESINSSSESQDAREKPSLRTREIKLKGWKDTLEQVLNKYLQYNDYISNEPIQDYSDMIDITFNEYINPSTESVLSVIGKAINERVYSIETGVIKVLEHEHKDYTLQDVIFESARIKGITPVKEMELLGLIEPNLPTLSESDIQQEQNINQDNNSKGEGNEQVQDKHSTIRRADSGQDRNSAE